MSRPLFVAAAALSLACVSTPRSDAQPPAPCGDPSAWRARALERSTGEARQALRRWTPGRPVASADRPHVQAVAREHLARCGTEEGVALTSQLVAFKTVSAHRDAGTAPEFRRMGQFLREWAEARGLGFRAHGEDDVWELSLGAGRAGIGFVLHGDVVPASGAPTFPPHNPKGNIPNPKRSTLPDGWTRPAFVATREGDLLYGRGTEDDKGPLASVLVVMDTLRRFDLSPAVPVVAIIGNGEESDWTGMQAYVKQHPPPHFTVSVDASFPLVVAESGFVGWHLVSPQKAGRALRCAEVVEARGGEFLTQIPGEAWMKLRAGAAEGTDGLWQRLTALAEEETSARGAPFRLEVSREGALVVVRSFGRSSHSSTPEEGANALWPLAKVAARVGSCEGGAAALLRLIAERLDGDHLGQKLGLAYADPLTGALVLAPTVLRTEGGVARLGINLRRPGGKSNAEFSRRLDEVSAALRNSYGVVEDRPQRFVGDPHLADVNGPLASTLLDIYRKERGDPTAQPIAIRGGTYGRLFPGAVSFGPGLPGLPYRGHAADEAIEVSTLGFQTRVLFEAVVRLEPLASKRAR